MKAALLITIAALLITSTAIPALAEDVPVTIEKTVIIQTDTEMDSFSIITDESAVETMLSLYPDGLSIGSVRHEFFCAKNHHGFTNFIPGACNNTYGDASDVDQNQYQKQHQP